MWFLPGPAQPHKFFGLVVRADRYFRDERPDAVVLIDYPGLHWWIAKRAKARGIPVFYYVPPADLGLGRLAGREGPQVRRPRPLQPAVRAGLVPRPRRRRGGLRRPSLLRRAGRPAARRGLPRGAARPRGGPLVAILPGSRTQEVTRNLPIMLRAAAKLARAASRRPVRGRLPARAAPGAGRADRSRDGGRGGHLHGPIEVHAARTPELIRLADVAWAVSGSVGLELMVEALPTVVLYKLNRFDLWVARPFIKAKYISLVNLLADAEVMPEYLTVARRLGRAGALGRDLARRPARLCPGDRQPRRAAASGRPARRVSPRRRDDRPAG